MMQAESPTGQPSDAAKVSRTIAINMDDMMRFTPAEINVKEGETIRFIIKLWQFTQAGTVDFACLIPGHTESGMIGKIFVS